MLAWAISFLTQQAEKIWNAKSFVKLFFPSLHFRLTANIILHFLPKEEKNGEEKQHKAFACTHDKRMKRDEMYGGTIRPRNEREYFIRRKKRQQQWESIKVLHRDDLWARWILFFIDVGSFLSPSRVWQNMIKLNYRDASPPSLAPLPRQIFQLFPSLWPIGRKWKARKTETNWGQLIANLGISTSVSCFWPESRKPHSFPSASPPPIIQPATGPEKGKLSQIPENLHFKLRRGNSKIHKLSSSSSQFCRLFNFFLEPEGGGED